MNLELPLVEFEPSRIDDLLKDVENAVDDAFLAEVDAALERLRMREPADESAAA